MITYKRLLSEEIKKFYETYVKNTFPADEVKPFELIKRMLDREEYACFGFYEEEELIGYAFLCEDKEHTVSILDYYEIMENRRGQGYGQKIIELLGEIYKAYDYVVLESEDPEYAADEDDLKIRTRRIAFYRKCGLKDAGFRSQVNGVEYVILVATDKEMPQPAAVREKMIEFYRTIFPEPHYTKQVRVHEIFG